MKTIAMLLSVSCLVGCQHSAELSGSAKTDSNRIEGIWTVASAKHNGERRVAQRFVFAQDNVTLHFNGGDSTTLKFSLRPSNKPKEIDLASPTESGRLLEYGIYSLEDDTTLALCLTPAWARSGPVAVRPKRFEERDFFGSRLLTLRRINHEKK